MSGDPLVCSFDVDKYSSPCAFPGCTGQQPHIVIPPFYPDSASAFVSKEEAQSFFDKLDKIFKATGMGIGVIIGVSIGFVFAPISAITYIVPRGGASIASILAPAIIALLLPFLFLCFMCFKRHKRKTRITEEVDNWNRDEGAPRGIYFALGGEDGRTGPSADDFWMGIYPTKVRTRQGGGILVQTNPKIHLYVNPTARREYCNQTGLEFYLPPQYIPVQVPGAVAYNMNNVPPVGFGQPHSVQGGYGQPPVQGGYGQPVFQGGYVQPPDQGGYAMTNISPPPAYEANAPSYDSVVKEKN